MGKVGVLEVEGLADLLGADTERQKLQALRQVQDRSTGTRVQWYKGTKVQGYKGRGSKGRRVGGYKRRRLEG